MIRNALGDRRWLVITGDCREILATVGDGEADNVIGDPPYDEHTHASAMSAAKSTSTTRTTGRKGERPGMLPINFEALDSVADLVGTWLRISRRWCLGFCTLEMAGEYRDAAGPAWVRTGVWHRPDSAPQFSGDRPGQGCEAVPIFHRKDRKRWHGGGLPAFWSFGVEREDRVHPTQKPLPLMLKLIEQFTDPGDLVLDPYCGSGTTGVACLALGRRFVGIERDPKYADLARERCAAAEVGLTRQHFLAGQVPLL